MPFGGVRAASHRGGGGVHSGDGAAHTVGQRPRRAVAVGDRCRGPLGVDRAVEGRPRAADAGHHVGRGGGSRRRRGEVEHRAIGGAGAVDRLDLEEVFGARRQAGSAALSVVAEEPVAVAGLAERWWHPSRWWARGAVTEGDRGRGVLGVDRAVEGRGGGRGSAGRARRGGRRQRCREVEHRAIGGGDAVDRLDLEVILGVGSEAGERGRLGGVRVARPPWGWSRSPW